MAPRKAAGSTKTTKPKAAPKKAKTSAAKPDPAKEAAAAAVSLAVAAKGLKKIAGSNSFPVDEQNQKLFVNVHLPEIKKLREKSATATSNLRNAYKSAKAEGAFTKADFDTAIQLEDEEREAKSRARIARQLVIARYMGKSLGSQLELFMEPDRTPSSEIAFGEGKQDGIENKAARPKYDPSTEQYREYMRGFHSVTEQRVMTGIKKPAGAKTDGALAEDAEMRAAAEKQSEANSAQRESDAAVFETEEVDTPPVTLQQQTSGIPTSRAQFLAAQGKPSAFSKRN